MRRKMAEVQCSLYAYYGISESASLVGELLVQTFHKIKDGTLTKNQTGQAGVHHVLVGVWGQ